MLERAGKAWSRRIADTWAAWERQEGQFKGALTKEGPDPPVYVAAGGEISTGLEIDVRNQNLVGANAQARQGALFPGASWQPRFGSIAVNRKYYDETYEARLFSTLTHEIGHVLGAWTPPRSSSLIDKNEGTWNGAQVVSIHGAPAPFREKSDSEFDFVHSGVCTSLMAYCRHNQAVRPLGPHDIDFAFLADLGMTVTEETDRPETYGLGGWTNNAGFTVSVSRDLQFAWADPQPHYQDDDYHWQNLDVTDLLRVEVDAFGHASIGNPRLSYGEEVPYGTARYVGGLIGAALYRPGLPPVTGDATLAIDLDSLDGLASFTSLLVYPHGEHEIFGSGSLHYPFEVSDNAILGTGTRSTLNAHFFGPEHDEVAGTLRDPRAGLLASFGATADERPNWENVIADANYMRGMARLLGSEDSVEDGWYVYRCGTDSSCESSHYQSTGWTDWTAQDREIVLTATAGWNWRTAARPDREFGFATISRQSEATPDGAHGRHVVDSYLGTLEYAGFGVGFEVTSDEWADPDGLPPAFEHLWVGFQGALSESPPDAAATWSGRMIGYERWTVPDYQNPFVKGLATVTYALADNQVDVAFSEIVSRDGRREVDDFGYQDIPIEPDGTFQEGKITGAFFGSLNEEVAGHFDNNDPRILGSFGARRLPDGATPNQATVDAALANIFENEDWFRVGADVAPPVDRFTGQSDFNGATVSSFALDENADLSLDDMGPWDDYSFHLRGEFDFAGGTTAFGVAHGDELVEPWASGPKPLADLMNNSSLSGTISWSGTLLGISTSDEIVSGKTHLSIEMSTLQGELHFTGLEQWGEELTPGEIGAGAMWGDGDLEYSISVQGNYFFRTDGDNGTVSGSFFGGSHQTAAGVLERSDLRAGFGGTR